MRDALHDDHARAHSRGAAVSRSGTRRRARRVLVVDDEPLMGNALAMVLSRDHAVDVVTSAAALERLQKEPYDVIVSDITMPGMNGMDFHDVVARRCPAQARRIVFLTGGVPDPVLRARIASSGRSVLDKPIDVDQLLEAVETHAAAGPVPRAAVTR